MRNHSDYSFRLVAMVVTILLLLHLLPPLNIGGYSLRPVNILGDVSALVDGWYETKPPTQGDSLKNPAAQVSDSLSIVPDSIHVAFSQKPAVHRIAYFGDSFIEGDIMVEEIRRQLQQRYGGCGVGWVDAGNAVNKQRLTVYGQHTGLTEHMAMKHETYNASLAGIAERYYLADNGATMQFTCKTADNGDKSGTNWDVTRLFLRAKTPVSVGISTSGGVRETRQLAGSPNVQMVETRNRTNSISYTIHGSGAVVFGVALECDSGVVVDNFSMRGSSGVSLPYIPAETLSDFARLRPYDVIVLQYGVNAIPPNATQQQCEWYMGQMKKTIKHLRSSFPNTRILLVSTPDRGSRRGGQIVTMPGIAMLVDYQRQLAEQEHTDFFSLFDAMGGEGSMGRLAEKGQAGADLIHITHSGGKSLASLVVPYLVSEYGGDGKAEPTAGEKAAEEASPAVETSHSLLSFLTYNPQEPLLFTSGQFLIIILFFTLVYVILRNRNTSRLAFVVLFSLYYYYKCSGICVLLLVGVTVVDYLLARYGRGRLSGLLASICMNLGLLLYFKYANFFAGLIYPLLTQKPYEPMDIILPVGISFFTFRSLSYAIDVYRDARSGKDVEETGGEVSLLDYAFYLTFFPVLLAGPITRAKQFLPQIHKPLSVSSTMFSRGVFLIAAGLIKKAIISDYIGMNFVDRVFDNPSLFTGGEVLMAVYGYCFQIYCDFSGYSDMAIGIALLMGFHIPDNFRKPFLADSMSDFWRRWHISLSTWIRDYIYIPLGGNRRGRIRAWVNQIVAMTLCGLWHGASLTFVLWGAVHGLLVCIHKFFSQVVLRHDRHYHPSGWRRMVAVLLTFHVLCATWVLFRCADLNAVQTLFVQLFTQFDVTVMPRVFEAYCSVFLLILLALVLHLIPVGWQRRSVALLSRAGLFGASLFLVVVIYLVIQVKTSDVQPFIYFQF